jgi:RNA polymerase sigma factor (sigma-70 family)
MPSHEQTPRAIQSSEPSDGSLLRGIRQGDDAAAEVLFERYSQRLHLLARRQLAGELSGRVDSEDVTQSIFRSLFRRLRDGQYSVPPGETIWRLLTTVALNKVRKVGAHHRAAKRDIRRSSHVDAEFMATVASTQDEEAVTILRMTIDELLQNLSESQRQIIELRLSGFEVSAIAEQSTRSKRSVERVLQGFRHRLEQALK